jgi:hypothetical protein
MELYLELNLQCKKKYEKLLLEITKDILQIRGIEYKNCTFDKIKGIILENDIKDNHLKYSIFKVDNRYSIKMVFSNGNEQEINF